MSQHIIRQQTIEITAADKSNSQDIFKDMSRLFNNPVKEVTASIFDKHGGDEMLLKIDQLEIDMGVFSFPIFEESFIKVYSEKLEEEIIKLLKRKEFSKQLQDSSKMSVQPALIQLLEQYLLTGTISWWVTAEELKDPENVFRILQEKDETKLRLTVTSLFGERNVRKRIVFSFAEKYIQSVISYIKPGEEEFISKYHSEVSQLNLETNIVKVENDVFRKELWLFILDFLSDTAGSHFNRKMFVRSTFKSIANRFNMSIEQVLFYFVEATKTIPAHYKRTENLVSIIEEISIEIENEKYNPTPTQKQIPIENNIITRNVEKYPIFFFLVNGFLPFSTKNIQYETESEITNEIQSNLSFTRAFFNKHGKIRSVRNRLITNFSEDAIKSVVTIVEPSGAEAIIAYSNYTKSFQKKTGFIKAEEKTFNQSLWELILSYLFSETGSVFNAKMFLISNIQSLARHYNMDYGKLLAILVQGVGQTITSTNNQSALFYTLTEILSESKEPEFSEARTVQKRKEVKFLSKDDESDDLERVTSIIDQIMDDFTGRSNSMNRIYATRVFLHLLEYGELPWWLGETKRSVEHVIRKLTELYHPELKNGLVFAATKNKVGIVFVEKYARIFSNDLIPLFDKTGLYQNVHAYLQTFVATNNFLISADVLFAKAILTSLSIGSGASFDLKTIFENVFAQVKITGNNEWKRIIIPESNILNKSHLKKINAAFEEVSKNYLPGTNRNQYNYSKKNFEFLLKRAADKSPTLSYGEIINLIPKWINEYLKSGKLPENIGMSFVLSQSEFIVWAMDYLLDTNKDALNEIISRKNSSLEQQVNLLNALNIFSSESELRQLVESGIQQQLQKFENSRFSSDDSLNWRQIIVDLNSADRNSKTLLFWTTVLKMQSTRTNVAYYLDDKSIETLFIKFERPKLINAYKVALGTFLEFTTDHFEKAQLRKWIVEFFLLTLAEGFHYYSDHWLAQQFAAFLRDKKTLNDKSLFVKLKKHAQTINKDSSGSKTKLVSEFFNQLTLPDKKLEKISKIVEKIRSDEERLGKFLDAEKKTKNERELAESTVADIHEKKKNRLAEGEQIYIANAGMVLLHPFIPTLFSRAGLMIDGRFIDETCRYKAALLLQYAATGNEGSLEHELVLNKILVGMQPEDVLDTRITLSSDDKDLISDMLKAIMKQWDKMKNTSLEGFVNSFLLRQGYVYQTDDAWVLRVEQRAYDLLLETLPWSFRMIKFSWMKKSVNVEWT
jgi:hypothetical protein